MAKTLLGLYTEKNIEFASAIEAGMKRKRINAAKLAPKIHICFSTHYKHLKNPDDMTVGELRGDIRELDLSEEDVLDALYLKRGW